MMVIVLKAMDGLDQRNIYLKANGDGTCVLQLGDFWGATVRRTIQVDDLVAAVGEITAEGEK